MNSSTDTAARFFILSLSVGIFAILLYGLLGFATFAEASHGDRFSERYKANPCTPPENSTPGFDFGDDRLPDRGTAGGDDSVSGREGGIHVPVKDHEAEALLRDIANNLRAIEDDTNFIEADTQAVRFYLRLLCEKEFEEDHTIQHAWMRTAGKMIGRIVNWINNAYGGNPIFIENLYVYLRNVDLGVLEAMMDDVDIAVREGKIDPEYGRIINRTLELHKVEKAFPDYIVETLTDEEKAALRNPDDFDWDIWNKASRDPGNSLEKIKALVDKAYENRKVTVRAGEREKLLWGDGFQPLEVCGQNVFSRDPTNPERGNPDDIRTCKTITPGSTMQDLTSIVLGSVIRQIENADEYEEFISNQAFVALNDVFSWHGLAGPGIPFRDVSEILDNPANAPETTLNPDETDGAIRQVFEDSIDIGNRLFEQGLRPKDRESVYFNDAPLDSPF